jgi:hypothetical protein
MMNSRRTAPQLIVLVLSVSLVAEVSAQGEPKRSVSIPNDMRELCQRIVSARESIVSYQVGVKQIVQVDRGAGLSPESPETTSEYYFEFSRIEDHVVYAGRNTSRRKGPDWNVHGKSDGIGFGGGSNGGTLGTFPLNSIIPVHFDPMVTGLQYCEMTLKYNSVADVLARFSKMGVAQPTGRISGRITKTEAGHIMFHDPEYGDTLVVDPSRGYWPISFQTRRYYPTVQKLVDKKKDKEEFSTQVTIKKVNGVFVPETCTISCLNDGNKGRELQTFTFDWISVNQVFETGDSTMKRLRDKFGLR